MRKSKALHTVPHQCYLLCLSWLILQPQTLQLCPLHLRPLHSLSPLPGRASWPQPHECHCPSNLSSCCISLVKSSLTPLGFMNDSVHSPCLTVRHVSLSYMPLSHCIIIIFMCPCLLLEWDVLNGRDCILFTLGSLWHFLQAPGC